MLNRRAFLGSMVAAGATYITDCTMGQDEAVKSQQVEQRKTPAIDINSTLRKIAIVLRGSPVEAVVDEHLVENPTTALVQWRWDHFLLGMDKEQVRRVERNNEELFEAMLLTHDIPNAGLESLMHEGLIKGREKIDLDADKHIHRALVSAQLIDADRWTGNIVGFPTNQMIEDAIKTRKSLQRPVYQKIYDTRHCFEYTISPLTRLGVGQALSAHKNVRLTFAEDHLFIRKAAEADENQDEVEYRRWNNVERDRHFVIIARENKRHINHLLLGYKHDLTDDIRTNNYHHHKKISHIVVTVPSIPREEKK